MPKVDPTKQKPIASEEEIRKAFWERPRLEGEIAAGGRWGNDGHSYGENFRNCQCGSGRSARNCDRDSDECG